MVRSLDASRDGTGLRVMVLASRFNSVIGERLVSGATEELERQGVKSDDITLAWVPGAFELPQAARAMTESGLYDALVCLGAVVRGETPHFDYVAGHAARGIGELAQAGRIPVIFGVLTTDTMEQAMERSGGRHGNKGNDSALAALETDADPAVKAKAANALAKIKAAAKSESGN